MATQVTVKIGNDTPSDVEELAAGKTVVLHMWIPSGRAYGDDTLPLSQAKAVWEAVSQSLQEVFDITPLATCTGSEEAADPKKWLNVYGKEVVFPSKGSDKNNSIKPYHVRFTATPRQGQELKKQISIRGTNSSVATSEILDSSGVSFTVTIP